MSLKNRRLRVLVADDDRDTRMTLGILFRSEGMHVRLASGAAEVAAAAAEFQPDVILLGRPALIAITAHGSEASKRITTKLGFRHHIAKPYDPDSLLELVGSIEPNN